MRGFYITAKIPIKTKKCMSKKKITKSKRPIKITFSKSKTVTSLISFSKMVKIQKQNKINVCKNSRNQKYKKALIIKLNVKNSNKKSINEGIQFSETKYDNDKYLLSGGTLNRKRKRVDYAKLNNSSFDIPCSPKSSNHENRNVSRRTGKVQFDSVFNSKKDDYKTGTKDQRSVHNSVQKMLNYKNENQVEQSVNSLKKKKENSYKNQTKNKNNIYKNKNRNIFNHFLQSNENSKPRTKEREQTSQH